MTNIKVAKFLGVVVASVGLVVMFGWFLDIAILKSILPQWVTMKFTTAMSFAFSGISLFCVAKFVENKNEVAGAILPIMSVVVLSIMAILFISILVGVRTGLEDLFVKEAIGAVKTTIPGVPSLGTMASFIIIGLAGVSTIFRIENYTRYLRLAGYIVVVLGGMAIFGYIVNIPVLYYTVSGFSTAMAVHTAILFVFLGYGFVLAGKVGKWSTLRN